MKWFKQAITTIFFFSLFVLHRPKDITLAFLGDVMIGRGIADSNPNLTNALSTITGPLLNATLGLANLESPITNLPLLPINNQPGIVESQSGSKNAIYPYDLRSTPERLDYLQDSGIDIVSIANNHINDCGSGGVADTINSLQNAHLEPIGPDPRPVFRNYDGLLLAFFAFNDIQRPLDIEQSIAVVKSTKQLNSIVIVSIHWGQEYSPEPSERQRMLAQSFANAGASIIWGHHPHVLQPVEWVQGINQDQPTLIFYSLGNTLFDQYMLPDAQRGVMLLVKLGSGGIEVIKAVPFIINVREGRIFPADPEATELIFNRLGPLIHSNK